MTGSLPGSSTAPSLPTNDPTELLRRVDRNMASVVSELKIFVVAVVVLVLVNLAFFAWTGWGRRRGMATMPPNRVPSAAERMGPTGSDVWT
jgi:hypothetical protein